MAYEAFTAEVDRIVKSPYPTQLKVCGICVQRS